MSEDKTEITKPTDFNLVNLAKQPFFIVMSGKDIGRKHPVDRAEISIGRSTDCDIVVKEHNVSRRHARVLKRNNAFEIEDLESTNGTIVNSKKISGACPLEDGDLVAIGKTILKFTLQSGLDNAFHDEVYQSATHDELTGAFNRKYFQKHLESEFARAERYGRDVSLILLDIDNFKQVNDRYGHPTGDAVLKSVGKTLKAAVRHNVDIPARYGGEEFSVLLPETGFKFAMQIAEKIRKKIETTTVEHGEFTLSVTVSVGVSSRKADTTPESLVREADEKLYTAKRKGKNRVEG